MLGKIKVIVSIGTFMILCVIGYQLSLLAKQAEPVSRSLRTGHIHKTLIEAQKTLQSTRNMTDKFKLRDIVTNWKNTNTIVKSNKIPWNEVPKWRFLAQNIVRIGVETLKKNPKLMQHILNSTQNIKRFGTVMGNESRAWRGAFDRSASAYASTLFNLYKESLH